MNKFKVIILLCVIGCSSKLFAQSDTLKKFKKHNFEFNVLTGVNVLNRVNVNYRNPFWKNVGFFSNFYFSIKAAKNFKIKNNYYIGIAANAIYFENYSQYEIGTESDKSYFYLKSNYYLNNNLLFVGLNLRKNWQLNQKRFSGFSTFSLNSNVFSSTISNGSTVFYNYGQYGFEPNAYAIGNRPIKNNGWFKNNTIKSNLMFSLSVGIKTKFNNTPACFTLGSSYSRQFPLILMSSYSILFGVTFDL